jgi:hypothetical protein
MAELLMVGGVEGKGRGKKRKGLLTSKWSLLKTFFFFIWLYLSILRTQSFHLTVTRLRRNDRPESARRASVYCKARLISEVYTLAPFQHRQLLLWDTQFLFDSHLEKNPGLEKVA